MTDPKRDEELERAEAGEGVDELDELEEEPRNPFDNPYFLPVLLGGFALWCGWDGFISDKFLERPGTLWFNRVMFLVLGAGSAWLLLKARAQGTTSNDAP
ncbi:MAG: hypothetical protein MUF70_12685 [Myxococcota bacterium]|jgi:hypothetical protein|nr:hypothetical protein [Myxococcota bacterium]